MKAGRKPDAQLSDAIERMMRNGISLSEMARQTGTTPQRVAYYARKLGRAAKTHSAMTPLVHGKRTCSRCGKAKTPGAFPTDRNTQCRMCFRNAK